MRWNYYKLRHFSLLQSAMDSYYKLRQLFYYKERHGLLQVATGITKCDEFIKNCDRYYKVLWLLQIATVQQHTFFVHFFAVVFHDYHAKLPEAFLMEEMWYAFSFTFFSLPLIFSLHWWPLAFLILSLPLKKFSRCSSNKKFLLYFFSLTLDLCRPFSRWVSLACRLLPLFLCLSLVLCSKLVDMTINLSLIL